MKLRVLSSGWAGRQFTSRDRRTKGLFHILELAEGLLARLISKATIRLYNDAVVKGGIFDVSHLNGSWSQNTLTYVIPPSCLRGG